MNMSLTGAFVYRLILCALFAVHQLCGHPHSPSPADTATHVWANPILKWSYGETIPFPNGSFEEGLAGWSASSQSSVQAHPQALAGTNVLRMNSGAVSRTIALPKGDSSIALNFSLHQLSGFQIEVRNLSDKILRQEAFHEQGALPNQVWRRQTIDLTEFAGSTVQLFLKFTPPDVGMSILLDDFRITVAPPHSEFDVYLQRPDRLDYLGRTNSCSWPLRDLLPSTIYSWRADAVSADEGNPGATWRFETSRTYGSPQLRVESPSSVVCADSLIPLILSIKDSRNFTVTNSGVTSVNLEAGAYGYPPPPVVISEMLYEASDSIEFINPTTNLVSLDSWQVQIITQPSYQNPPRIHTITLPEEAQLEPGSIFTVREYGSSGSWPHLLLSESSGSSYSSPYGVILRDDSSNIVDAAFGRSPSVRVTSSLLDWRDTSIRAYERGKSFQRIGSSDLNDDRDWILADPSIGRQNDGLHVPFAVGFGPITTNPTQLANFMHGWSTNNVAIPEPWRDIDIFASPSNIAIGETKFRLSRYEPEDCAPNSPHPFLDAAFIERFKLRIQFSSHPGSIYRLLRSTRIAGGPSQWQSINLIRATERNSYFDVSASRAGDIYFRVVVFDPSPP